MARSLGNRKLLMVMAAGLLTALIALVAGNRIPFVGPQEASAQEGDGRYHALIFSRTTGFRHSEAIEAGHEAFDEMAAAEDYDVTHSEDASLFTDHGLRQFDVIVFLNTDGEGILNARQRNAFERWMQRGGGAVSIHADANADRNWEWKTDMMGGALFDNHPQGPLQFQAADVVVEDDSHPATAELPPVWNRVDEWYNFTANPRDDVHVLLTLDEESYEGGQHGDDHPIAWCTQYDGGRHFYTALGHEDAANNSVAWSDDLYRGHIQGALEWAAGEEAADCGPDREGIPTEGSLQKVTIEDDVANPMSVDIANDGRVFWTQMGSTQAPLGGPADVKMHDPETGLTHTIATLTVHRRNENGLTGIALDPNFDSNGFIYLYYSEPGPVTELGAHRLSRFTFDPEAGEAGQLDMDSEVVLLKVPHQRQVCCHTAGSIQFGPDDLLYLSTGDDTEHARSDGRSNHDARPCGPDSWNPGDANCNQNPDSWHEDARHANDSRRSAGNTNDLRGKILRIDPIEEATPEDEPGPGSTYEIPEGNLFDEAEDTEDRTRPEIYTMGHRNPFRFGFDEETGWIYQGEVGPDAGNDSLAPPPSTGRGPRGYDEINQIREAGNFGWPYCIADNKAYRPWVWTGTGNSAAGYPGDNNPSWPDSGPPGEQDNSIPYFDCENGPFNHSPLNDGLEIVPPGQEAWIYYPYGSSPEFPDIPQGGGRAAMGGPVYRYDPELDSDVKLSEWFDGKLIWGDWTRNVILLTQVEEDGSYGGTTQLMPGEEFRHPHDIELGPDGALYIIEWGNNFNYGSYGVNPDAGIYRIEQRKGGLPALANAQASPTLGQAPLEVNFRGELSDRGADDAPTYEWDFGDGESSTEANPTHTYEEAGTYEVTLTVTDEAGTTTDTVTVTVTDEAECGPPRSDDFEAGELDDTRWDVIRRDDERLEVADGALTITAAKQDIFQGDTGLPNIVVQDLPGFGSLPWTMTVEMTWNPTQDFQNAGMIIYDDDDNYIKTGMVWNGSRNFELIKEAGGSATFEGTVGAGSTPNRYFMRFVSSDGNSVESQFSADGENWTSIGTTNLDGFEQPRIGVYATASTQAAAAEIPASFHSIEITPDREPCGDCGTPRSDEFDGSELDEDRWGVVRRDDERLEVADGALTLTAAKQDIFQGDTGLPNIVLQPLPGGGMTPWSITVDMSWNPTQDFQNAGLIIYDDDDNYIKTGMVWNGSRNFELIKEIGGSATFEGTVGAGTTPERYLMRYISADGNTVESQFSADGQDWTTIGTTNLTGIDDPRIGVYATASTQAAAAEIPASFHSVAITPDREPCDGEDDVTPPETTAQLNGEPPTSAYTGPVDVTLSATDPGASGGPQNYDVDAEPGTWGPDQVDLEVGDQITWHFPADAGFPHDVWLVPPGGDGDPNGDDIFEVTDGIVQPGGDPVSYTFEEEGEWVYVCKLHASFSNGTWSGMVGTANVSAGGGGGSASGVAYTEYRVDSDSPDDWVRVENDGGDDPFVTDFTVEDVGQHVVEYRSADAAGNVEETKSVEFTIDEYEEPSGEPALRINAKPKKKAVRKKAKRVAFNVRIANRGDAAATGVRVCAKAPKKKIRILSGNRKGCQKVGKLADGSNQKLRFQVKPKKKAVGKKTRIKFIVNAKNAKRQTAVVTLRVRRN